MKLIPSNSKKQQGNTLLVTIIITALIGFVLATYLTLVQGQHTATMRSQAWNMAMPVVEAGIEDALQHVAKNAETGLAVDGWTRSGNVYTMSRFMGDSFYMVQITNYFPGAIPTNGGPIIDSYGYVSLPGAAAPAHSTLLATAGSAGNVVPYLGRGVKVRTMPDFTFTRGMVAKDSIDLNGNNIRTDSFDSQDPRYSTNGLYVPLPAWTKANGDIAVNSSLTNSLMVGNANIWGSIATGPGGSASIGANGIVGDDAWHNGGNSGIQAGHSKNDMNVSFPDAKVPFSGGATPSGGWLTNITVTFATNAVVTTVIPFPSLAPPPIVTNYPVQSATYPFGSPGPVTTNWSKNHKEIVSYRYPSFSYTATNTVATYTTNKTYYDCLILDGGDYRVTSLSGSVYIGANTRMYVTTSLNISDLVIKPGCYFSLYTGAPDASIAGNNTENSDGTADSFSFYGLPTCTNVSFSGNAKYTGTIYAPDAALNLNGGGNEIIDFTGASITKTAKLNGHFSFHYDEALRRSGPFRGYIINGWFELVSTIVPPVRVTRNGSAINVETLGSSGSGGTGGGGTYNPPQ